MSPAVAPPSIPTLTRATLHDAVQLLAARDAGLARIVALHGPPPLWARPRGFATLVRIILEQQVSLASAATLYARVASSCTASCSVARVSVGMLGGATAGLTRGRR